MKKWIGAAALVLAGPPALAANVAVCTLSADKKTVTVTASNPYSQVMACEVNCDMALPNGIATVVCVKPVPAGAKDFVMCAETAKDGKPYTRVKGTEANCPDPAAPPAANKNSDKDGDDDDQDADELIKKLQKQGQDFIDQQRRK
jgi:hypothetical protein